MEKPDETQTKHKAQLFLHPWRKPYGSELVLDGTLPDHIQLSDEPDKLFVGMLVRDGVNEYHERSNDRLD